MKNLLMCLAFFVIFSLTAGQSFSQTVEWLWAKSAGGSQDEMGVSLATDPSGNIFVAGYFKSPSLVLGSFTLVRTGTCNVFLAKYDAYGNVVWAISAAGSDYDMAYSVATDALGNVVVAGLFSSPVITFGSISLTNAGIQDAFLTKYDANGNVLWAKRAGGGDWDNAHALDVDDSGNVYLAGSFRSPSITFGSITLTNSASGIYDAFLVKYDAGGNVLWATSAGGPGNNIPMAVSTDQTGNVFLTGNYTGSLMTFGSLIVTSNGLDDLFLAKYDASGGLLWAKSQGGTLEDNSNSVATDAAGNAVISGFFRSETISFGAFDLMNFAGWYPSTDIFLTKYDGSGNVLWATGAGGPENDRANSVATDAEGHVYCTGIFLSDTAYFGSFTIANTNYRSDLFVVKYDTAGSILWALRAGGTDDDIGNSVATDATGDVFITGNFASPSIAFSTDTLTNSGNGDLFLARLDDNITGIDEYGSSRSISIFPNPAIDRIHLISLPGLATGKLTVFNFRGEQLIQRDVDYTASQLDISDLSSGLYIIKLVYKQEVRVGKFIRK